MTLIKTGSGITDIRGGFGGVYFTRDKSGLHCAAKPRRVAQGTPKQQKQRGCFSKARTYSKDERVVSYLIYRCLNDLPFIFDAIVTGDPDPDCRGTYELTGVHDGKDYYKRKDSAWFIWYWPLTDRWFITSLLGSFEPEGWAHDKIIEGTYTPWWPATGNPVVTLEIRPPPPDYQIPKL